MYKNRTTVWHQAYNKGLDDFWNGRGCLYFARDLYMWKKDRDQNNYSDNETVVPDHELDYCHGYLCGYEKNQPID